jgi:hypothetical protein
MDLKRPNKKLEKEIQTAIKGIACPLHRKEATIEMPTEKEPVIVTACCEFFKKDIMVIGERMRKDFLYRDEKTRERIERERKKNL